MDYSIWREKLRINLKEKKEGSVVEVISLMIDSPLACPLELVKDVEEVLPEVSMKDIYGRINFLWGKNSLRTWVEPTS